MTDSKDVESLPTAAYETIFPENIGGWSAHKTEHLADKAIENAETESIKHELVRREDVVQLIQDKIAQLRNAEAETKGQHNVKAAKAEKNRKR